MAFHYLLLCVANSMIVGISAASFGCQIGGDLLLAVSALLEAVDGGSSAVGLERVQLATSCECYSLWKQSMREMEASLAISG
jgi:hypothetical protein